jgi:hypothetical protein
MAEDMPGPYPPTMIVFAMRAVYPSIAMAATGELHHWQVENQVVPPPWMGPHPAPPQQVSTSRL